MTSTATSPNNFCDKVDRIYFNEQGCISVNILLSLFQHPMKNNNNVCSLKSHVLDKPENVGDNNGNDKNNYTTPLAAPHMSPPEKPSTLPYIPTVENISKLESYLLKGVATSAFNGTAPFPAMTSPQAHIHLKPDSMPYARYMPIPVPHHLKLTV